MRPDALADAIAEDRAARSAADRDRGHGRDDVVDVGGSGRGRSPTIAAAEGLWLHVDSAYAGAVALIPERRDPFRGWERADSIVVNPHKWLFAPLDASLLLTRRLDDVALGVQPRPGVPADARPRAARPRLQRADAAARAPIPRAQAVDAAALVRPRRPSTADRAPHRAWRRRSRAWLAGARRLRAARAGAVLDGLLPLPAAARSPAARTSPTWRATLDELNTRLLDAVNRTGEVFLSHTRLRDRFTIRLAVGNLRTEERHVRRAFELLVTEAERLESPATAARPG